jgi:hypothetical protein
MNYERCMNNKHGYTGSSGYGITHGALGSSDYGVGDTGGSAGDHFAQHGASAKLGSGERFKALTKKLAGKGAKDPKALAASIGREKYGAKRFAALSKKGKK